MNQKRVFGIIKMVRRNNSSGAQSDGLFSFKPADTQINLGCGVDYFHSSDDQHYFMFQPEFEVKQ